MIRVVDVQTFEEYCDKEGLTVTVEPAVDREAAMTGLIKIAELIPIASVGDWDDDNAEAISAETWGRALLFLAQADGIFPGGNEPFISPCGDGSVHFFWHDRPISRRLLVEIKAGHQIMVTMTDGTRHANCHCDEPAYAAREIREYYYR